MRRPRYRWKRRIRLGGGACALLLALLALLHTVAPFPHHHVAESRSVASVQILDRERNLITWRVDAYERWRVPVPLAAISPWVVQATVAAEDKRFFKHRGVDPIAVMRALGQNLWWRRRISGASTLSMQTIRLLTPRPRTWTSKCIEAFRALQLEAAYSKSDILELYLNNAPYGGNVVGIEAAAQRFFGKPAHSLTLGEAALLAGLPQSPARFNPEKHLSAALHRRAYVLQRMQTLGRITRAQLRAALREPIAPVPRAKRTHAPRFADWVIRRADVRGGIVRTPLDPAAQRITRSIAEQQGHDLRQSGIDGLAIIVIDIERSAVAALIGNGNPDDPQTGWINAARAPRQPGSLLKPFLYALAYERGLLTPASVVYDIPTRWTDYAPENIDHSFMGPLSAADALRYSRNLPAVHLLDTVGEEPFGHTLREVGLPLPRQPRHYGLSLALGTAEMRLTDLTNAYAALARLGRFQPLRIDEGETLATGQQAFTPSAAWLALKSLDHSDNAGVSLAWKTGTSWNHRDAWTIALTPRYAVGVWAGTFASTGNDRLVGSETALPIALEVLQHLPDATTKGWSRPAEVISRPVCALSGAPQGRWCRHTVEAYFLAGISSTAPCTLHGKGEQPGQPAITWPAEVCAWIQRCNNSRIEETSPVLHIERPSPEATYVLTPSASHLRTLSFRARSASGGMVTWILDGERIGQSRPGMAFPWDMQPGAHTLVATTPDGAHARHCFSVTKLHSQTTHQAIDPESRR